MNKREAIRILKKKMYEEADEITIEHLDGSQCMRTINIDLEMKEAIEVLEQPITLAELLGWEEGQEYEYRTGAILMLDNEKIYYKSDGCSSGWCNYNFFGNEIEDLRKAKKVEKKETKEELLDELQELVSSKKINEIIEKLRSLDND